MSNKVLSSNFFTISLLFILFLFFFLINYIFLLINFLIIRLYLFFKLKLNHLIIISILSILISFLINLVRIFWLARYWRKFRVRFFIPKWCVLLILLIIIIFMLIGVWSILYAVVVCSSISALLLSLNWKKFITSLSIQSLILMLMIS